MQLNKKPKDPKKQRQSYSGKHKCSYSGKHKCSYSGKHKCHTIKEQLIINGATGQIVCVHHVPARRPDAAGGICEANVLKGKGKTHDLELFRQSDIRLFKFILFVGDKGYQGICDIHENSMTPYKKPKGGKLTKEQKAFNRSLSKFRIFIEHVNRRIKRFKMFQGRYRNKQRKHHKRISLICGIHNYELEF